MFALLLLTFCAIALAKKNQVCCAQTDLNDKLVCISNVPTATCAPSNAQSDKKTANCCKSKKFACDQYFILVNELPVASTCENGNGGGIDTDTTTDDTDTTTDD